MNEIKQREGRAPLIDIRSADNLRLGDTVATDMDAMNCVPQGSVPNRKGRVPIGSHRFRNGRMATGGR